METTDWISINIAYGPIYDFSKRHKGISEVDSFSKRGLAKSGTIIELENGDKYLIGDINESRGICDDCVAFDSETIIAKYKIAIDMDNKN